MIEFIISYKNIKKHIGISSHGFDLWQVVPISEEIFPYLKYFKDYYNIDNNDYYSYGEGGHCEIMKDIKNGKIKKFNIKEFNVTLDSRIYNDYILFEFPDEETAFYFKLKFCC